jgi:hypothetical protein
MGEKKIFFNLPSAVKVVGMRKCTKKKKKSEKGKN